jgi:hypothetical protein
MGESYLSDLSLAFIEDMGFYVANYSFAGRMADVSDIAAAPVVPTTSILVSATRPEEALLSSDDVEFTPGFLRWGRLAGCDFCQGSPKNWPEQ